MTATIPPVQAPARRRPAPPLPEVPGPAEKYSYVERNLPFLALTLTLGAACLIFSQVRFELSSPVPWPFALFTAVYVAYQVISLPVNFAGRGFDLAGHQARLARWRPAAYPSVDIYLPICGEPIEVLRNTWAAVAGLAAGYPGLARAYVLDDGPSEEARRESASFGFEYLRRPGLRDHKKSGNLRYAFARTEGEFILILDADFAPRADLPAEMLPYLMADESLGIIQSPQYFRTRGRMSWMERGAGAVQELFYRTVQVSRDRNDGAICVGSCAIYRRTALATNGGTSLIEHSEDVHTGFDLRGAGWGLRYIPVPLAAGLCPSDPGSFLVQQYRWCTGSMSLLASRKFWATRMRFRTRCCYLSGFCYYAHTALFTFVAPAIPLVMLIVIPERVRLANYLFIAPSLIYNLVVFPAWHRCRYGPEALMAKLLYGWAHIFALWDICRRKRMGWQTTGGGKRKTGTRRIWVGLTIWNGGTGVAWVGLAAWRIATDGTAFIPLLATGLIALFITGMALGSGRNHARIVKGAHS